MINTKQINKKKTILELYQTKSYYLCKTIYKFYLPTDDDLVHLFKCYYDDIPEIEELFTRQYSYKALWKTKEEFYLHFEGKSGDELDYIKKEAPEFLKKHKKINDCFILNADIKQKKIERNELFICIDDKIKSFNDIETRQEEKEEHYFILYIPKGALKNKKIIIQTLNKIN